MPAASLVTNALDVRRVIELAIDEDLGAGDVTAALVADAARRVEARVVARASGVACGIAVAAPVCESFSVRLGASIELHSVRSDGDAVAPGDVVATIRGPHPAVLALERTLLNFICRLSGVATLTRRFVDTAREANPAVRVYDTRKTIPGWRVLDKYAVRCGGGYNHRMGLYDAVLIKDNHLAGVATSALREHVAGLLGRVRGAPAFVEVEVDRLDQLAEVCRVPGVQVILLDNFRPDEMRAAVAQRDALGLRGVVELEASGGVTLDTVREIAATGVERIAVGAITHSAPALDFGLDL